MKVKISKKINYFEAYLTLRCNLGCSYCINQEGKLDRQRKELSVEEWIDSFNRIDFNSLPLTLGGGEPTMYPGFYDLLDGLNKDIRVDLLTNLTFDVEEFIGRVSPEKFNKTINPAYRSIRVSYHAEKMNTGNLVDKVKKLQDAGFSIGIFGLNHPKNTEDNMQISELARKSGIYFFIKDFLGDYNGQLFGYFKYPDGLKGKRENVLCKSKDFLVAPDGLVYKCHRDLYAFENPLYSITDPNFKIESKFRKCENFGECNPCDLKLKTNRFLQMGNCQVEIQRQ